MTKIQARSLKVTRAHETRPLKKNQNFATITEITNYDHKQCRE